MANLNKIILIGHLTADPEMRFTVDGTAVTKYRLAVQRPPRSEGGEAGADFIPIVCFGRVAEISGEYLKKGKLVLVEGRIQVRNYTTAEGQNRWTTEVVASTMRMLDRKEGEKQAAEFEGAEGPADIETGLGTNEPEEDNLYDDIPF